MSAAAQDFTLRLHHFAPAHSPVHAALAAPWAAKLEKDSGGKLRIPVYPALGLGGSAAHLARDVKDDEVDIALTRIAFTPRRFPKTEVFELPFLEGGAMARTWALQDYYARHLQEEFRGTQVVLLFAHEAAALHVGRPVRRLEDFKGLKLRAAGAGGAVYLRALGAVPIGAPDAALGSMLAKGLLDGCLAPFGALPELDLEKLVRHHVALEPGPGTSVLAFLMSAQAYASLPAELRRLVDAHSGRHLAWYAGKTWEEAEAPGRATAERAGNELSALPMAEAARVHAAVRPELERYLAEASRAGGFDAAALYRDAQALIARYQVGARQ
ncbi:MAG TPA: TRAP transporter substrate-binding protein [Burkholderiales bacterium]|nr:TRAP transporter substrate-binding protein [Burkholderiales bacterium]